MEKLFSGNDLDCLFVPGTHKTLVVTFSQYVPKPPAQIFGRRFLDKLSMPYVGIRALRNHWWHTSEMDRVVRIVQGAARGYDHVITYGASMGGHGALAFSEALNAAAAIAVSPQSSIFRDQNPFETRWQKEAAIIRREARGLTDGVSSKASKVIIYDPLYRPDLLQVRPYLLMPNVQRICISLAGHMPLQRFLRTGSISMMMSKLVRHSPDVGAAKQFARAARRADQLYWLDLALRRYSRSNPGHAMELLAHLDRHAILSDGRAAARMAQILYRAKEYDEALRFNRASTLHCPTPAKLRFARNVFLRRRRSDAFDAYLGELAREKPEAVPIIEEFKRVQQGSASATEA